MILAYRDGPDEDPDPHKLEFVRALPEPVIEFLANITFCKSVGEERLVKLANTGPIVPMALLHGEFTTENLRQLSGAVGVRETGESDREIAEAIYGHMIEMQIRNSLGDLYPAFD